MTQWYYFIALVVSISCLLLIDWRHKLAFWYDWRRTSLTIAVALVFFFIWDFAGISLGIFFSGSSPYALSFMLLPEFPVEEILFLFLLCHLTLLMYRGGQRGHRHIRRS